MKTAGACFFFYWYHISWFNIWQKILLNLKVYDRSLEMCWSSNLWNR